MDSNYESMLILKTDLTDEEREGVFNKIVQKIEALGGEVKASNVWAKERNFFYPIRSRGSEKKRHIKGCYWLINFSLERRKIPELRETIRLEEKILRNIIIKR
jgi:ribosomal protein S6